jgi:D-alanyl-D-alanine carboxypeptidase
MGRILIIAAILAVAGSSVAVAEPDGLRRDVDAIVEAGVTGVQARVSTGRTVPCRPARGSTATGGVADLDTGRPVRPDGHFRIGSTTKTFVSTVVLQLAGERVLALDDTVERWLPGMVRGNDNDGRAITIRHLLQHTSGINDGNYPSMDSAAEYYEDRYDLNVPEEIVAAAMELRPHFAPNAGWAYSNTGYVLLGMIIERATGRPWHVELADRIVRPLCLTDTYFPGADPTLPRPHAAGYQQFAVGEPLVDVTKLVDADASGGLVSTTADINTFFRALFGGRLLRPAELAQMLRDPRPIGQPYEQLMPGARYGLGIFEMPLPCGGSFWMHPGGQNGFSTNNGVTPDGRRAVTVSASATLALAEPIAGSPGFLQERRSIELVEKALCR